MQTGKYLQATPDIAATSWAVLRLLICGNGGTTSRHSSSSGEVFRSLIVQTHTPLPPKFRIPPSEELLRLIFESARDFAIFSTDADGIVTSWNAGAERLL